MRGLEILSVNIFVSSKHHEHSDMWLFIALIFPLFPRVYTLTILNNAAVSSVCSKGKICLQVAVTGELNRLHQLCHKARHTPASSYFPLWKPKCPISVCAFIIPPTESRFKADVDSRLDNQKKTKKRKKKRPERYMRSRLHKNTTVVKKYGRS